MKGLRFFRSCLIAVLCLCLAGGPCLYAQVEEKVDTRERKDVVLYLGDLVSLKVYSLTRIAISKPGVVEIVNADVDEILLVGKSLGQTQIFIWDEFGKRSVLARVMEQDLHMIKERIEQLLAAAEIKGIKLEHSAYEGKLIATGKVNSSQKEEFDKAIGDFSGFLINMVDEQGDLIQIDAQITQLDTTLEKTLGVQWSQSISVDERSMPTNTDGYFGDIIKIGDLSRTSLIEATVNALLATSQARTLSRPSVVVSDGEEASILVGGEIPVVTSLSSDGAVSEDVQYKSYGVQLSVTPEIKDDEKIDITLNVSVSDIGAMYGENASFTTTSTNTKVLLDDGQTVILAGLIKQGQSITENKVPFLSSIPLIGIFFRYKQYIENPDTELVISLTPRIRRQKNKLKTQQEVEEEEKAKRAAAQEDVVQKVTAPQALKDEGSLKKEAGTVDKIDDQEALTEEERLDRTLTQIEEAAVHADGIVKEAMSSEITDYAKGVQRKIAERISFPYQAKEEGKEGTAVLSLTILSDGKLNDVSVAETSGYSLFDNDAVNTAQIVSPFEPFPVELEMDEITISVPVVYSQDAFLIKSK
ncbi:MAG TPA: TonB family protein [Candidatus Bathyarchaeia archaeon]|nr:TonB family protein [Candidatus Bathyarchaeia archaeon]